MVVPASVLERRAKGSLKMPIKPPQDKFDLTAVAALVHADAPTLRPLLPAAPCNGYWHGKPGMDLVLTA